MHTQLLTRPMLLLHNFRTHTGIIQQVIIARDGLNGSTCPIRSGFIFLGHYQAPASVADTNLLQVSRNIGSSSSSGAAGGVEYPQPGDILLRQAGFHAERAKAAGEQASDAAKAVASNLGGLAYQPWVTAAHDLTSAAAVHTASGAGLLPPIIDYAHAVSAEFIEFAAPSHEQLRQQQQEWAALCGAAAAASSSSGARGSSGAAGCEGAWPVGGFLTPVLWFR
jgi:hypothetical protein